MANSRRSKHEVYVAGGVGRGSKSDVVRCKKHPKHRQSPGVCSLCLKEKLYQLSNNSWSRATSYTTRSSDCSTSSSLSSYYSSSSASSYSTPAPSYRYMTQGKGSLSMSFVVSANNVLKKSRSLAFAPRTSRRRREHSDGVDEKKKGGFWSKLLLRHRSKRTDETSFMHSRTVRESKVQ
ncbi:hypothetical protein FEM48_Zijuj06G0109200 [Ziziphus jujuba var. spinosa]|uniref:Uncharacterized protein n=1 Tax=Ziziphus jujuba var. spinosa TaxID=714518 RepID=A0A978V8V7_ZIZJJ|nr:uncharacterized protein LOC107420741 [Ziziphus jujuba var. spinosa]KAH7524342.1 hypothetical protein FEM48_Zijuj06G0109200 [Ziziphus jujuba var. spinosa]